MANTDSSALYYWVSDHWHHETNQL